MAGGGAADGQNYAPEAQVDRVVGPDEFCIAAAYLDHGHIYGQCNGLVAAGASLTSVFDPDPERVRAFAEAFPSVRIVESFDEILGDPRIDLVAAAAVPDQRASIGEQVLQAGKDYYTDKSPFTTLEQLDLIREVVAATEQRYFVYYAERIHNEAAWRAGELIADGAVGRVLQVLNLAPHRLSKETRPDWFFEKQRYGGILTDIGSHQVEQFLTYAGCTDASVSYARVANFGHPDKPGLEDFGECAMVGDNGAAFYTRVDWYTPEGSPVWGDGRTFVLGSEGTIEMRKYLDPARKAPASRLFLTDGEGEQEIDCQDRVGYPHFGQMILDALNRTEFAMTQDHAFKAAELSMVAQAAADAERSVADPS